MESRDELLRVIRGNLADPCGCAVCELLRLYIDKGQRRLESATLLEVPELQGKIKAWRGLLRDMRGERSE